MTNNNVERIGRREFIKLILYGVGRAGLYTSGFLYNVYFRSSQISEERQRHEENASHQLKNNNLRVDFFAKNIVEASSRITFNISGKTTIGGIFLGWITGDLGGEYLLINRSELLKRVIFGFGACILGRILDIISTNTFVQEMNDPRFKEYGLYYYYSEISPLLSSNPTSKELAEKTAPLIIGPAVAAGIFPFIGRGILGSSIPIAINNVGIKNQIQKSIYLGDQVKELINNGADKKTVDNFLQTIQ